MTLYSPTLGIPGDLGLDLRGRKTEMGSPGDCLEPLKVVLSFTMDFTTCYEERGLASKGD